MKKHAVNKKFKQFVEDAIYAYSKCIDSAWYQGKIFYMDYDKNRSRGQVHADVLVDHRYLKADFRIYPVLERRWKEDKERRKKFLPMRSFTS